MAQGTVGADGVLRYAARAARRRPRDPAGAADPGTDLRRRPPRPDPGLPLGPPHRGHRAQRDRPSPPSPTCTAATRPPRATATRPTCSCPPVSPPLRSSPVCRPTRRRGWRREAASTPTRCSSGPRPSGTTTTAWTSPPRTSGAGCSGCTSSTTTRRTRSACRPGDRDLPLVICDRSFGADGSLLYPPVTLEHGGMAVVPPEFQDGVLGDVTSWSTGSRGRCSRWPPCALPAAAAQRLQRPAPTGWRSAATGRRRRPGPDRQRRRPARRHRSAHDAIDLSPGERYDVVVDSRPVPAGHRGRPGQRARARDRGRSCGSGSAGGCRTTPASRQRLSTVERLDPGAAAIRRSFDFRTRGQRGTRGPSTPARSTRLASTPLRRSVRSRCGASPATCTTRCTCTSTRSRSSRAARRAGGRPRTSAGRTPWTVRPSETVEVAVRFTDYAGRYVVHCHNLEHEDMAMMANVVTR